MAAPPSLAARRAHDRVAQDAGLAEELATELARALQLPGTNRTLGRTFVRYGLAALKEPTEERAEQAFLAKAKSLASCPGSRRSHRVRERLRNAPLQLAAERDEAAAAARAGRGADLGFARDGRDAPEHGLEQGRRPRPGRPADVPPARRARAGPAGARAGEARGEGRAGRRGRAGGGAAAAVGPGVGAERGSGPCASTRRRPRHEVLGPRGGRGGAGRGAGRGAAAAAAAPPPSGATRVERRGGEADGDAAGSETHDRPRRREEADAVLIALTTTTTARPRRAFVGDREKWRAREQRWPGPGPRARARRSSRA